MKIWLVGENNPYGSMAQFALYPEPSNSAGGRLCRLVMGMDEETYLATFERVNLLQRPKWSVHAARQAADSFVATLGADDRVILLGRKVAAAFSAGVALAPFEIEGRYLVLPHPSGLCRQWHVPGMFEKAKAAIRAHCPSIASLVRPTK